MNLEDRIAWWRDDDKTGYDQAIALLCEAEELIRQLRVALCNECGRPLARSCECGRYERGC